jgi:shikimate dehydrogenase
MPAEHGAAVRRAAVLGHPVAHSLSPVLHRTAYAELGLTWEYDRVDITPEDLPAFLDGLGPDWAGLSLTMPLKTAVLPLLDELDPVARATGAANTVVFGPDGRRSGFNTDVEGMVQALMRGSLEPDPAAAGAAVIGGGATARSAIAAAARLGATLVHVRLRRPEAADDLRRTADAVGVELDVAGWDAVGDALTCGVVVSTVPSGVADDLAALVPGPDAAQWRHEGTPADPPILPSDLAPALLDVVYDPWPTPLAAAWSAAGGRVASGLDMLLHQAVAQVELMTGSTPSEAPMRRALQAAAAAR